MKKKYKNIAEGRALVEKYRELADTEEQDLTVPYGHIDGLKTRLTGFGSSGCTLCQAVDVDYSGRTQCVQCFHSHGRKDKQICCTEGVAGKTFRAIDNADLWDELRVAYKKRADYIEQLLNRIEGIK